MAGLRRRRVNRDDRSGFGSASGLAGAERLQKPTVAPDGNVHDDHAGAPEDLIDTRGGLRFLQSLIRGSKRHTGAMGQMRPDEEWRTAVPHSSLVPARKSNCSMASSRRRSRAPTWPNPAAGTPRLLRLGQRPRPCRRRAERVLLPAKNRSLPCHSSAARDHLHPATSTAPIMDTREAPFKKRSSRRSGHIGRAGAWRLPDTHGLRQPGCARTCALHLSRL